jgi:hypothetical protein
MEFKWNKKKLSNKKFTPGLSFKKKKSKVSFWGNQFYQILPNK